MRDHGHARQGHAVVVGGAAWHTIIRPEEEADLAARSGAPYEHYRAEVRCWVPTNPSGREPRRQSVAAAASEHAQDDQAFIDALSLDD